MEPPREGLKIGDLVDGDPVAEIHEVYGEIYIKITYVSGIIAIADAIPDMAALIKLDISKNCIGTVQGGELQRICLASDIELAWQTEAENYGK
jgi:hypothetical protein